MRRIPHRVDPASVTGPGSHFLTLCTHQRHRYFDDPSIVEMVVLQFLRTAQDEQFEILAYCLMPDHMHALVDGLTLPAALPRFVRIAKQRSGYEFRRRTGRRLWQESYFDRTLRADEAVPEVVNYIISNPVRAGLVASPIEYPHWGSGAFSREELLEFIAVEVLPRV